MPLSNVPVACYRHLSIEQQLCRFLLLSFDRLPSRCLKMTQESIANMLGVRLEGVTEAAGKLQRMGAIEYRRGNIVVLDHAKLEHLSCECYAVIKRETDRLLPKSEFLIETERLLPMSDLIKARLATQTHKVKGYS